MISRKLAGASAAGIGAATAVTALLLGTVSGSAAAEPIASAYGLAAQGLLPIDPTPLVQAPPDGTDALVELPSPLGVGVLKVAASGNTSSAIAVDLDIADLIKAQIIKATCDNGVGDVSILSGDIGGSALPSDPGVGQDLDLSPIARIVFNTQSDDNGVLTVDALRIAVLPGGQLPDLAITPDNLEQLGDLAPNLKVPTMQQLQAEQTQAAEQAPAEQAPVETNPVEQAPVEQAPTEEPTAPTLESLLAQLTELNPGLEIPTADGDALLDIVISSATCGAGQVTPPGEAPKPKPIETQLPVTH